MLMGRGAINNLFVEVCFYVLMSAVSSKMRIKACMRIKTSRKFKNNEDNVVRPRFEQFLFNRLSCIIITPLLFCTRRSFIYYTIDECLSEIIRFS